MNYDLGFQQFRSFLQDKHPDLLVSIATLEERFYKNQRAERLFGSSENIRNEHAQIIYALNELALSLCALSFNEFCSTNLKLTATKGTGEAGASDSLYGTGNRWAVLIGANHYDDSANYGRLQVCLKDTLALQDQLMAGGFKKEYIHLLADESPNLPTRDNILSSLKSIADATEPDDLLLFYYSGHGDELAGESYLVARNGRRTVLSDTGVPISRIKEIVEQAPARAKVILLDACHSGADIGGKGLKPMSEEFIRRVFEQAEGIAILASCKQGQVSYEWRDKERSVFTHYLLDALSGQADRDDKGFVTVQDVHRHVSDGIKLWASQRNLSQTPTLQYTVAGDIVLTYNNRSSQGESEE